MNRRWTDAGRPAGQRPCPSTGEPRANESETRGPGDSSCPVRSGCALSAAGPTRGARRQQQRARLLIILFVQCSETEVIVQRDKGHETARRGTWRGAAQSRPHSWQASLHLAISVVVQTPSEATDFVIWMTCIRVSAAQHEPDGAAPVRTIPAGLLSGGERPAFHIARRLQPARLKKSHVATLYVREGPRAPRGC